MKNRVHNIDEKIQSHFLGTSIHDVGIQLSMLDIMESTKIVERNG